MLDKHGRGVGEWKGLGLGRLPLPCLQPARCRGSGPSGPMCTSCSEEATLTQAASVFMLRIREPRLPCCSLRRQHTGLG